MISTCQQNELNGILKSEITALLTENNTGDNSEWELPQDVRPYVILVVGVNGVGKNNYHWQACLSI